jgi:hypothetical protein
MKIVKIIIATFMIAFATSLLFELNLIVTNPVRYCLVILLILIELITGFYYVKSQLKNSLND